MKFNSTRERKIIHGSNQHHNVSKRKKIFARQVNQQAYRDKNECKTLITLKETLGPQIAHCESENRNFIEFRDDFLRERQQPRQVIQFGVKSISMSFRRVPRPENTVEKTRFSNDYLISDEFCPIKYIQVAYFLNHGQILGENTPHKHHTMSRLKSDNRAFSTSRFSHRHETPTIKLLTILTHGFSSSV